MLLKLIYRFISVQYLFFRNQMQALPTHYYPLSKQNRLIDSVFYSQITGWCLAPPSILHQNSYLLSIKTRSNRRHYVLMKLQLIRKEGVVLDDNIVDVLDDETQKQIYTEMKEMTYTKNFRSPSAEEWYIFLPSYKDPATGGAAGKTIIQYNIFDNKEIFINTTIIFDDPALHKSKLNRLVYALSDEIVNRLVGYADTLLSVHSGENSYNAVYKQ